MTYKRKITGVQQSGSKQKQRKSDEEYSDLAERASSKGTSRGKRRGARGARGTGELRRSQRISKAPAQGCGEKGEDEGEDEEEEVLLTSTQQKALQTQQTPPIQQTQQRQMAQQTQQTPPIQQTQQSQTAKWPNKPNKPHLFNKSNNCLPKPIHYNNFNNFNFNKTSKAKQPLLVTKCLPSHHLHRYSLTQMTEKSLY